MRPATVPRRSCQNEEVIVYCAGTSYEGIAGTDVHMARQLSRHAPVLYVDPPVPLLPGRGGLLDRRWGPTLRQVDDALVRLTPRALPGHTRRFVDRTTTSLLRRQVEQAVRALGVRVAAVVVATLEDLLDVCDAPRRVFYGTDDYVAGAELMGLRRSALMRAEVRQLAKATDVVAVSPCLLHRWSGGGRSPVLLTNGCDVEAFSRTDSAPRPTDLRLTGPIAGVVGHISARTNMDMLEAVAASSMSLLLLGPVDRRFAPDRMRRLLRRPNVQAVGQKRFAELPSYLGAIDVGLTPYADTPFNWASFPLKTLEYLAAGLPVVSTDLPATRWLGTDLIAKVEDPKSFADAALRAVADAHDPALVEARRAFAEQHSWERRATALIELLDDAVAA
ncbi:glycosyltransferase [Geodermatophilus sp. SYSU D01186]